MTTAEEKLAKIEALFATFDWEQDDRQYALEAIEAIVESEPRNG